MIELPLSGLPEGATVLGAFAGIKCLDADGQIAWHLRYTDELGEPEVIGQMTIMRTKLVADVIDGWEHE